MTPKTPIEREGRSSIKTRREARVRSAAKRLASVFPAFGIAAFPLQAAASEPVRTASSQVDVGTLPLLAALGIGIAVAVAAVIAFLQMTAKGKQLRDLASPAGDGHAADDDFHEEWHEEGAEEEEYEDHSLADYTIPVTAMLSGPDAAEPAQGGEPRLNGLDGEHAGASYAMANRRLSIGRDPSQCGIVFPLGSGEVSRKHCTVRYVEESGKFMLEDHGSSNGTFLSSGERLLPGKPYELRSGDRFSLSGKQHLFEVREG